MGEALGRDIAESGREQGGVAAKVVTGTAGAVCAVARLKRRVWARAGHRPSANRTAVRRSSKTGICGLVCRNCSAGTRCFCAGLILAQ